MGRPRKKSRTDSSSHMDIMTSMIGCLILILISVLILILVSNSLALLTNPENIDITAIIRSPVEGDERSRTPFPFGNKTKDPTYIDVFRDRLIIYPEEDLIRVRELEESGNNLELLLDDIEENRDSKYVILLIRPHSAKVAYRLRKMIKDERRIDLGFELFEAGREVKFPRARGMTSKEASDEEEAQKKLEKEIRKQAEAIAQGGDDEK